MDFTWVRTFFTSAFKIFCLKKSELNPFACMVVEILDIQHHYWVYRVKRFQVETLFNLIVILKTTFISKCDDITVYLPVYADMNKKSFRLLLSHPWNIAFKLLSRWSEQVTSGFHKDIPQLISFEDVKLHPSCNPWELVLACWHFLWDNKLSES